MVAALFDVFSSTMWRTNDHPLEPFAIFQRSSSISVSDLQSTSLKVAQQPLKSFSLAFCFCGNRSFDHDDSHIVPVKSSDLLLRRRGDTHLKEAPAWYVRWWQVIWRPFARRRSNDALAENRDSDHQVFYRPPKWKLLLRRLRAETSKMNCVNHSPGFHYDPLSYAKNFDDGCWQQCDSHVRGRFTGDMFSTSLVVENGESCHKRSTAIWRDPACAYSRANISLWQRRNVSQPPTLDVKTVGV